MCLCITLVRWAIKTWVWYRFSCRPVHCFCWWGSLSWNLEIEKEDESCNSNIFSTVWESENSYSATAIGIKHDMLISWLLSLQLFMEKEKSCNWQAFCTLAISFKDYWWLYNNNCKIMAKPANNMWPYISFGWSTWHENEMKLITKQYQNQCVQLNLNIRAEMA